MRFCFHWALCAALIGFAACAAADEVRLEDGTVLLGTMGGMADGALQFEASFGGTVSIPWAQVTALQSDKKAAVTLKDGKNLTGTLAVAEGVQSVNGGQPAVIPLALGDVTGIVVEGQTPPAAVAAKADAPAPEAAPAEPAMAEMPVVAEPGAEAPPALEAPAEAPAAEAVAATPAAQPVEGKTWAGRAELGLNGQSGNKERFDVRAGIDMNRKAENWRLNLYLKGQYAEANSERSANEVMGGTRAEWDINDRTYVFGKVDLEHDEFEDLELRATLTAGLGHYFVKREKLELKGWLGAGYEHETFEKDPEPIPADLPEPTTLAESMRRIELLVRGNEKIVTTMNETVAELGYSYRQDLKKNFRFNHGVTYYPSVDDPFGEYRVTADTALEFPVGKDPMWTLRAGVRNEFDARPQDDVDRLDTTYYLNLGYNW